MSTQAGVTLETDLVGDNVEEVLEGTTSAQEETPQEEPDYKVLWEQSEAARKKSDEDSRAQRIQLLTQRQRDLRMERVEQLVVDINNRLNAGTLDEGEAKAEIRKGITDIEEEIGTPSDPVVLVEDFKSLFNQVNAIKGLSTEEVKSVSQWYEQGRKALEAGKLEVARAYLSSAQTALELVTTKRGGTQISSSALGLNNRAGARAPGPSDQEWLNRYSDEVNGNIPGTPANVERARTLMAKGLVPKSR